MEKYLIELLETNNRVIVPDLGAFIIRQQEPRELVFNDLLAFNDGMLTAHIKQEEGISMSKAQVKIEAFVDQVKKVLTRGDIYHIENLGYLKMDDSSKIEFSVTRFPTVSAEIISAATLSQQEDEAPAEKPSPAEEEAIEEEAIEEKPPARGVPEEEASEAFSPDEEGPYPEKPEEEEETERAEWSAEEVPEEETPEEETPEEEAPEEQEVEWKPSEEDIPEMETAPEATIEDGGFTLEDQPAEIEVDASEDKPLIPEPEEPPFLIEEQQQPAEKKPTVVGTSRARLDAAAEAAVEDEKKEFQQKTIPGPETSFPYYVERERSIRNVWPWIGGAAALIIILLVAAWFFFPDQFNRILGGKSAEIAVTEESLSDESAPAMEESAAEMEDQEAAGAVTESPGNLPGEVAETEAGQAVEESVEETLEGTETEPEPEPVSPPPGRTEKYYIVAGMFSSHANAQNYVNTLKEKGYNAEIFGKKNNLYGVSFNSYESKSAAILELDRIKEEFDPKAWLLLY